MFGDSPTRFFISLFYQTTFLFLKEKPRSIFKFCPEFVELFEFEFRKKGLPPPKTAAGSSSKHSTWFNFFVRDMEGNYRLCALYDKQNYESEQQTIKGSLNDKGKLRLHVVNNKARQVTSKSNFHWFHPLFGENKRWKLSIDGHL